jgi:hypothetical protein
MYTALLALYIIISVIHFSSDITSKKEANSVLSSKNEKKPVSTGKERGEDFLSPIEWLTRHRTKTKHYAKGPKKYNTSGRDGVMSSIQKDRVTFKYTFPLVGKHEHTIIYDLYPNEVSVWVSKFGVPFDNPSIDVEQSQISHQYIIRGNVVSPNHKAIVDFQRPFTRFIAESIRQRLMDLGQLNHFNLVQSVLNFVQYIPYGIPDFDTKDWDYMGLAVPPESFILGYSDCDSKSVFMASILSHLILREQIILVRCRVKNSSSDRAGAHMMIAVSDLEKKKHSIYHKGKYFLLIETTTPCDIYHFGWHSFSKSQIVDL